MKKFLLKNRNIFQFSSAPKILEMPKFNHQPPQYEGPSYEEVLQMRKDHLNPGIFLYYKKPIFFHYGKDQWLYDNNNKRYLDLFGGIVTVGVGHNNDAVNNAVIEQIKKLNHTTTIYLNNQIAEYAKELSDKLPEHLNNIYFVNSGSEANELAVQLARLYTGNYSVISTRQGYHGMSGVTQGLTNIGSWNYNLPLTHGIEKTIAPDTYRGQFTGPDAADQYANDVKSVIQFCTSGNIAGFICEPIQGAGGAVEVPKGYLKKVYQHVKEANGLAICDEVQTGFGRTGTHYWGFERHGVKPDIVVMAKSIGNGFPLAAVATSKEIASVMKQKLSFNTYGGNPVSCAAGRQVIKQIDELGTQQNCLEQGNRFIEGLNVLKDKYECIGDVRGSGLMLGVDIVTDKQSKQPNTQGITEIFEKTKDYGILLGKSGAFGNVLRIKPPMIINKDDVDYALSVIDRSIWEYTNGK